jgi:hypothetical protein
MAGAEINLRLPFLSYPICSIMCLSFESIPESKTQSFPWQEGLVIDVGKVDALPFGIMAT